MAEESHPNFEGRYQFVKSEKFDEFLSANGVNWLIRKMAGSSKPDLEITQKGNEFYFKLISMVKTRESSFTVGTETEETQQDGSIMKLNSSWEGDKLIVNLTPKVEGSGKPQKHTRELRGEELILTLEVGDVVATRIFKKTA